MTLIHRKNKKQQPVIIGLAVLSVIIVIVMIVFLAFKDDDKDKNEVAQEIESSTAFEMLPTEQVEETTEYGEKAKEYYIDYVIVGDNPGSKYDKAVNLGITIIEEEGFMALIKE